MQLLPEKDCVFWPMRAGLEQCMMKPYAVQQPDNSQLQEDMQDGTVK